MNPALKDEISRLRSEAKHHREQAGRLRRHASALKARHELMGAFHATCRADERTAAARACDIAREQVRAQMGGAR